MRLGSLLQCGRIFLESYDVFAHHPGDRRVQLRMNEALDLVNVIRRRDRARAGFGIIQPVHTAQIAAL